MQSITFGQGRDWWVPGRVFDRLLRSAEQSGRASGDTLRWLRVAEANYGLDVSTIEPASAADLVATLRDVARRDLAGLANVAPTDGEDGMYRSSLEKLLELTNAT